VTQPHSIFGSQSNPGRTNSAGIGEDHFGDGAELIELADPIVHLREPRWRSMAARRCNESMPIGTKIGCYRRLM
jgi:hypothetical protein